MVNRRPAQPKAATACPLYPKADMCGAAKDVRFGPIADIGRINFCPAYLVATEKIGNLASEEIGYLKKLEPRQNLARLRTLKSL
jgi:hypothetical protein